MMTLPNHVMAIDPSKVRDLRPDALDPTGRVKVLPSAFWEDTTLEERALFGHLTGTYLFPTTELVDHLRQMIGDRLTIEIGSGNGTLARALKIAATDSYQQAKSPWREMYGTGPGQLGPPVNYGSHVEEITAYDAVRAYRPQIVIGAWVTHRYDPRWQTAPGNPAGVVEEDVLANCGTYIFIGDDRVHRGKPIWRKPHTVTSLPFIHSRATGGGRPILAVWPGSSTSRRRRV